MRPLSWPSVFLRVALCHIAADLLPFAIKAAARRVDSETLLYTTIIADAPVAAKATFAADQSGRRMYLVLLDKIQFLVEN